MINLLPVLLLWIFPLSSHLHDGVEEAGVAQVVDALNGDEGAVRCALASPLAVLGLLAKLDDFRHRSCQHTHTHHVIMISERTCTSLRFIHVHKNDDNFSN